MRHIVKRFQRDMDACTQFSIAMVYDRDVAEVAAELGTWGAVTTRELREYLVRMGLSATGSSTQDVSVIAKGKGMMNIHGGLEGHAMAYEDGIIYDPNGHTFDSVHDALQYYTFHTGRPWVLYAIFEATPIEYREWTVGKTKEEAI
jgi:hypothetical protein